jgi:hypothetical protein
MTASGFGNKTHALHANVLCIPFFRPFSVRRSRVFAVPHKAGYSGHLASQTNAANELGSTAETLAIGNKIS